MIVRLLIPTLLVVTFILGGCAKATCTTISKCSDDYEDDVLEQCTEDYKDGDSDCKKSFREFADCIDEFGCTAKECSDYGDDVDPCETDDESFPWNE